MSDALRCDRAPTWVALRQHFDREGQAFDLRCRIREGLIDFMQREHPQGLPQLRFSALGNAEAPQAPHAPREGAPARPVPQP